VSLLEEAVRGMDGQISPLRARALASLARELHHTWDPRTYGHARAVAADAVKIARSLDDPSTLAFCLLALHDTRWSVGSAGERVSIVAEMLALAQLARDRELFVQAQLLRATALLELGDPAARGELERYSCERIRWTARTGGPDHTASDGREIARWTVGSGLQPSYANGCTS
jgi:hypothetical protein